MKESKVSKLMRLTVFWDDREKSVFDRIMEILELRNLQEVIRLVKATVMSERSRFISFVVMNKDRLLGILSKRTIGLKRQCMQIYITQKDRSFYIELEKVLSEKLGTELGIGNVIKLCVFYYSEKHLGIRV